MRLNGITLLMAAVTYAGGGGCHIDQQVNPATNKECWDPPASMTFQVTLDAGIEGEDWSTSCSTQPAVVHFNAEGYDWRGSTLLDCDNAVADLEVRALFPDVQVWDWCNYNQVELRFETTIYRFVEGEEVESLLEECEVRVEAGFTSNSGLDDGIIGSGTATDCGGITVTVEPMP